MTEERLDFALCALPEVEEFSLPEDVTGERASAIQLVQNKWTNGTTLRFHFLADPAWQWPEPQKQVVRQAFAIWKALGIGLSFVEVTKASKADLLIGFLVGGSWSWVGTDVRKYRDRGRNMNYGWDLTTEWGRATALHEIGHAIGMPHEHQNPKAGLVWNEPAVYEAYAKAPNKWDQEKTYNNIIRKLSLADVEGSNWDVTSIMHYPFAPGLISQPAALGQTGTPKNVTLSPNDRAWVKIFYPPLGGPQPIGAMELKALPTDVGAQADFIFEPTQTREYVVQSLGRSDVKIVIFTDAEGGPAFLAGMDDSGTPENAKIIVSLTAGEKYTIRVRTHFANMPEGVSLVVV